MPVPAPLMSSRESGDRVPRPRRWVRSADFGARRPRRWVRSADFGARRPRRQLAPQLGKTGATPLPRDLSLDPLVVRPVLRLVQTVEAGQLPESVQLVE